MTTSRSKLNAEELEFRARQVGEYLIANPGAGLKQLSVENHLTIGEAQAVVNSLTFRGYLWADDKAGFHLDYWFDEPKKPGENSLIEVLLGVPEEEILATLENKQLGRGVYFKQQEQEYIGVGFYTGFPWS
jgi:hypothetical protein